MSTWAWMAKAVTFSSEPKKQVVLKPSPAVMDNLWGYYYATGALAPLQNIVAMLPWSKNTSDAEKLTIQCITCGERWFQYREQDIPKHKCKDEFAWLDQ